MAYIKLLLGLLFAAFVSGELFFIFSMLRVFKLRKDNTHASVFCFEMTNVHRVLHCLISNPM